MKNEVIYPVSETFVSPQGEGFWSGQRMFFLRLAGCSVGKPIKGESVVMKPRSLGITTILMHTLTQEKLKQSSGYGIIPIWQEECTTFAGDKFLCDTDFRVKERLTVKEIMDRIPDSVEHMCITGGEPLIHNLQPIAEAWFEGGIKRDDSLHIETSGTKLLTFGSAYNPQVWVTVSPKLGCLDAILLRADEVKFLVDEHFDETKAEKLLVPINFVDKLIWLSPINGIKDFDSDNAKRCLDIQSRHPSWRISIQLHKALGCS